MKDNSRNCVRACFLALAVLGMAQLCSAAMEEQITPPPAADEKSEPAGQYAKAYKSMSTADWLLQREMNDDAAMLYGEAMKMFQQLASDYPLWQTNLVAFRINYCREGLNRAMGGGRQSEYKQARTPVGESELPNEKALPVKASAVENTLPRFSGIKVSSTTVGDRKNRQEESGDGAAAFRGAQADWTAASQKDMLSTTDAAMADKIRKGAELEKEGDFNGALELYRFVLERNNQDPKALGGAGRCLLRLGKIDEARSLLFQWSVVPSPDKNVNLLLVLILVYDKQFSKALQLADILLNEDKSNADAHVIVGVALAGTGQTDAAIAEMQKALSLNARLPEAHYNLARLLVKKGPKYKSTAIAYYINAMKFGAAPDAELARQLQR